MVVKRAVETMPCVIRSIQNPQSVGFVRPRGQDVARRRRRRRRRARNAHRRVAVRRLVRDVVRQQRRRQSAAQLAAVPPDRHSGAAGLHSRVQRTRTQVPLVGGPLAGLAPRPPGQVALHEDPGAFGVRQVPQLRALSRVHLESARLLRAYGSVFFLRFTSFFVI